MVNGGCSNSALCIKDPRLLYLRAAAPEASFQGAMAMVGGGVRGICQVVLGCHGTEVRIND